MKKRNLGLLGLIVGFLLIGFNVYAADGDLIVNGYVGIGTTNPYRNLHVYGATRISNLGTGAYLELWGIGDSYNYSGLQLWSSDEKLWQLIHKKISGETNNFTVEEFDGTYYNERLVIRPGGNVGIGATDPGSYKLYINGTAYSTGGWQSSDIRFKSNITPIDSALTKILNLRGVSFNWKTEEFKNKGFPEDRHYGVIAQEVERVLPEVVKEGPEKEKSVSYTEIVPVLIEAMKEQQKEIQRLKSEVTQLKNKELIKVMRNDEK